MLEVTSDIFINVYDSTMNQVGNITLSKNGNTEVTMDPCDFGVPCDLTINFKDQNVKLDLIMIYDSARIPGYWEWRNLTIEGTIDDITISATENGKMNIHPKGPGFTQSQLSDISCGRGYSVCAPLSISWYCADEVFSTLGNATNPVTITFPSIQLQPYFNNANTTGAQTLRFGVSWNCDPILSIPIWTGLLIGLGLLMGFLWAIGMIATVNTPDRFDDPKGKQISVPQQD